MRTENERELRHSADVRIVLSVNGHALPVGQLAPDFVVLDAAVEHPPTDAEILMSVDGNERRWAVRLVDGLTAARPKTPISKV